MHRVEEELLLPDSLGAGSYVVSFGILNPSNHLPAIRLANKGVDTVGHSRETELNHILRKKPIKFEYCVAVCATMENQS